MKKKEEQYWRITDSLVSAGVDERDNPLGPPQLQIYCTPYPVIKRTHKGVWIWYAGRKRFILDRARKKFACATKDEAEKSFIARKERQIKILSSRLQRAKQAKAMVEAGHYFDPFGSLIEED